MTQMTPTILTKAMLVWTLITEIMHDIFTCTTGQLPLTMLLYWPITRLVTKYDPRDTIDGLHLILELLNVFHHQCMSLLLLMHTCDCA